MPVYSKPCCACLSIEYDPEECGGGAMRERWICKSCGTEFKKRAWGDRLRKESEELKKQYHELIFNVQSAFPGESRHETALRYIKEAEKGSDDQGSSCDKAK